MSLWLPSSFFPDSYQIFGGPRVMGQQFCRMMPHHLAIRGLGQGKYESRVHLVSSYQV